MATILIDSTKTTAQAQTLMNSAVPGDTVAFERGGQWTGHLSINNSGTTGNVITYTAYGSGNKPIIDTLETFALAKSLGTTGSGTISTSTSSSIVTGTGTSFLSQALVGQYLLSGSTILGVISSINSNTSITLKANALAAVVGVTPIFKTWVQESANVWRMPFDFSGPVIRLWLTKTGVTHEAKRAQNNTLVNATDDYFCSTDYADLYLYVPTAGVSPATYYDDIQWTAGYDTAMDVQNCSYYTISNLDLRGGKTNSLILYGSQNFTIENCDIGLGVCRVPLGTSSLCNTGTIRYNTIDSGNRYKWQYDVASFQNGVADGFLIATGCHNFDVYGNHFKDCGHSLVEVSNMYHTDGSPQYNACLVGGLSMSNINIYENLFTAENVNYCRAFGCDNLNTRSASVGQITFTRNRIVGVPIQSQVNFDNALVCYNIWSDNARNPTRSSSYYGPFGGILVAGYSSTSPKNMTFHNNHFVNLADQAIRIAWASGYGTITGNKFYNNVFYNCGYDSNNPENAGMAVVVENLADPYAGGNNYEFANEFRNNIFWKPSATTSSLFVYDNRHVGSESMTVSQFQSSGNGFHSDVVSGNSVADPLLQGTDYYLGAGSPALSGGIAMSANTALKAGSSWPSPGVLTETLSSPWTIGAYGTTTSATTTTTTTTTSPTTTTTTTSTTTTTTVAPTTTTTTTLPPTTTTTTTLSPSTTTTTTSAALIQVRRRIILV